MTIRDQMRDYIGIDAHMEQIKNPKPFNFRQQLSKDAQILWITTALAKSDNKRLSPVVELVKEIYPSYWAFASGERLADDEWMMELAYRIGKMDGKREERTRRKQKSE